MMKLSLCGCFFFWRVAICGVALAQTPITECDRLAAHPSDPDKLTEGVETEKVRLEEAIKACREAVKVNPDDARRHYQLGRVLFYKGEHAEGFRHIEQAARLSYRQAQFVAGYIHTEGYKGFTPPDDCKAFPLWRQAAERGHYAAEVSLSRNHLRGVYAKCGVKLDQTRVIAYLESAKKKAKGYYENLLVDYLLEQARKEVK
jgi:TPR repeat protein